MTNNRSRRWPRARMTTGEILISGTVLAVLNLLLLATHMLVAPALQF
jgi:hypothetical protein